VEILIPKLQEKMDWWKALLTEEDLVDRSIFYFQPRDSEPDLAIPVGKSRRTGYCICNDEDLCKELMQRMRYRPFGFPNLRLVSSHTYDSGLNQIEWGDDINDLWAWHKRAGGSDPEVHRQLGRAFGYKEIRIMTLYPAGWPKNKNKAEQETYEKFEEPFGKEHGYLDSDGIPTGKAL
jgi:hypothetical protein